MSNCCDNENKIFISDIIYDCEEFQCAGLPALTIKPCMTMCEVFNIILTQLCTLSGAGDITASNVGGGIGVFYQKVSSDLEFKSFIAGDGITLDNVTNPEEIIITSTAGTSAACIEAQIDYTVVPGPYSAANNMPSLTFNVAATGTYNISVTLGARIVPNDNVTYQVYVNGLPVGIPYLHTKDNTATGGDYQICHFETCKPLVAADVVNVVGIAAGVGQGTTIGSCNLFIQRID
mgnify:FL=1